MKQFCFAIFAFCLSTLSALSSPLQDILDLFGVNAQSAQDRWIQKGKERWEFDKRYEYMRPVVWPLFEKAGFISEAAPEKDRYDYALVFGALLSSVEKRIAYLAELQKKGVRFGQLVFLAGERSLLASEKSICLLQMEGEMVEWLYQQSELSKDIPVLFINAEVKEIDGRWVRPQTSDTIVTWLKTNPIPGNCLAVSNQPYVQYQRAVLEWLLPDGFGAEVVGPEIKEEPTVALILDTIAKTLLYDSL